MRTPRTLPDADLVALACRGDEVAFAVLYRRHVGAVERVASAHSHDREARRDMVQDARSRACRRTRIAPRPNPVPALARRDHAQCCDRRTAPARRRATESPLDATDDNGTLVALDPAPSDVVVQRDVASHVLDRASHLSARDAAVLALAGRGLGPSEIAPVLGMTTNCAKVVLHRARRRLSALADSA